MAELCNDGKSLNEIYNDDEASKQYWISGESKNVKLVKIAERYMLEDVVGETYNVHNNLRYTHGNPETFDRTIWMIGTCVVRGYAVSDSKTIPSIFQNLLLDNGIYNIRVVNFGGGGGLNDFSDIRDFINVLHTKINKNDIVVHIGYNVWEKYLSRVTFKHYYELSWLLNRRHTQRLFLNTAPHLTSYANKAIAKYIFAVINEAGF